MYSPLSENVEGPVFKQFPDNRHTFSSWDMVKTEVAKETDRVCSSVISLPSENTSNMEATKPISAGDSPEMNLPHSASNVNISESNEFDMKPLTVQVGGGRQAAAKKPSGKRTAPKKRTSSKKSNSKTKKKTGKQKKKTPGKSKSKSKSKTAKNKTKKKGSKAKKSPGSKKSKTKSKKKK